MSKFGHPLDEFLFEMAGDCEEEDALDVITHWFGLLRINPIDRLAWRALATAKGMRLGDIHLLDHTVGAVLHERDDGSVDVELYATEAELQEAWATAVAENEEVRQAFENDPALQTEGESCETDPAE